MNIKKLLFPACMVILSAVFLGGCGTDTANYYLQENEMNYFKLEKVTDLSGLGESMDGTKDMLVALDAEEASYILDSLDSLGEVNAENLSLEFNLNGTGDYSKLSALSSLKGLASLTVAGINENQDISGFLQLENLTTLALKDQVIHDYTPLSKIQGLKTLSLSGASLDYSSLMKLSIENLEIPLTEQNWVALDLLATNEGITNLNQVKRDQFRVSSLLEGEQHYYDLQFDAVAYLSQKRQEITVSGGETLPAISGSLVIAGAKDLVMPSHYAEQALLKTDCGFSEEDSDPPIFFPMIKEYTGDEASASIVTIAGTDSMNEKFITAATAEDAEYIFYVYAVNAKGTFTSDYTSAGLQVYGQFYDAENKKYYAPALLLETPMTAGQDAATYQSEVQNSINEFLKGYAVNT